MSPPILAEITISIGDERRDALLSALRRGDAAEATSLLQRWSPRATLRDPDDDWEPRRWHDDRTILELSDWVRTETRLHVQAGRFQHALALLERYVVLPPTFTATEAKARALRLFA